MRFVVALMALCAAGPAAALNPARRATQYETRVWDKRSGLPSNNVTALTQSPDGTLWVGTDLGLVRFDGRRFEVFGRAHGLPSDEVQSLHATAKRVWVGTSSGLAVYEGGAFHTVTDAPAGFILRVLEDGKGRVWISTHDAAFVRLGGAFERLVLPSGKSEATVFAEDKAGAVWIAATALWRFSADTYVRIDERSFARLSADADGDVWGVTRDTLVRVHDGAVESFPLPRNAYVDLVHDGGVWLASGSGLSRRSADGTLEVLGEASGLASVAQRLLPGKEGELWIATQASGLMRLRDTAIVSWSTPEGLAGKAAYALARDGEGVAVATEAGVYRVGTSVKAELERPGPPLASLLVADDAMWLGTDQGLFVRRDGHETRVSTNLVFALASRDDGVWAASSDGLLHIRGDHVVATYGTDAGAPSDYFIALSLAADGTVWVGHRAGACRLVNQRLDCFGNAPTAPHGVVLSIATEKNGDVWLGTNEDGLYRVRGGVFQRFADGFPSLSHYVVLDDDAGHLWTSSSRGLTRISKSSLDAGKPETRLYAEADGMRSSDCMGVGMKGVRAANGDLWFATTEGAAVVTASLRDVGPSSVAIRDAIVTQDRPGWVNVGYGADTTAFADTVTFRHQLIGFDEHWVETTEPVARYTNVPPGSYRFAMQARTRDWGDVLERVILVPTKWYETTLARVAAGLALIVFAWAIHRVRLRVLVAQKRQLEEQVRARTQELSEANATLEDRVATTVAGLREAERLAAYGTMVAGVAHEVRQPMFALGTLAFVLQSKLADRQDLSGDLALVVQETKRMNVIMDELLAFAQPPALKRTPVALASVFAEAVDVFRVELDPGAKIVIVHDSRGLTWDLDGPRLVQVLVNLMANAHKHVPDLTRIVLNATADANGLIVTVENDGTPIARELMPKLFELFFGAGPKKGSGLGLSIVRRVIELHGGTIIVEHGAIGTCFRMALPRQ